jgi:hypothetical protein
MVDDRIAEVHASGSSRSVGQEDIKVGVSGSYSDASGTLEIFGSPSVLLGVDTGAVIYKPTYNFTIDETERKASPDSRDAQRLGALLRLAPGPARGHAKNLAHTGPYGKSPGARSSMPPSAARSPRASSSAANLGPRWRACTTSASQQCHGSLPSTGWPAHSSWAIRNRDGVEEREMPSSKKPHSKYNS